MNHKDMTYREYVAVEAMNAILAAGFASSNDAGRKQLERTVAPMAFRIADAMCTQSEEYDKPPEVLPVRGER